MTQIVPTEASDVTDLLSLTTETYLISAKYISYVKNPSSVVIDLLSELKSLKSVLSGLSRVTEDEDVHSEESLKAREMRTPTFEDTEGYRETLGELHSKLQMNSSDVDVPVGEKALIWPISEEQTQSIVKVLREHVRIFAKVMSVDELTTAESIERVSLQKNDELSIPQGIDALEKDDDGRGAFHHAAASGDVETMKKLLDSDSGIDIEEEDGEGVTPLLLSIRSGRYEAVRFLLDRGADISRQIAGDAGMHAACIAVLHDLADVLKLVIDRGSKLDIPADESTVLHVAARNNRLKVLPVLLDHGLSLSARSNVGETPLHVAALKGNTEVVQWLLDHGAEIDAIDKKNGTALGLAANSGHEETVDLLCQKGANVNQIWSDGLSILEDALQRNSVDVTRKLISHGAIKPRERELVAVFRDSLTDSNCAMMRLLIELDKTSILQNSTTFEPSPLHVAARRDDVDFAKFLIANGFEIYQPTLSDEPVIYVAIEEGSLSMIEYLLENGGHLESEEGDLVQFALDKPDEATATLLVQKGVKFDRQEALLQAVENGTRHNLVKIILDQADDRGEKLNLDDAVAGILGRKDEEMCDLLFDRGADSNTRDYFGTTALHLAEDVDRARELLGSGAYLEARDHESTTPLLWSRNVEMTRFLASQGADLRVRDRRGWTALHYAAARCTTRRRRRRTPSVSDVGGGEIVEFLLSQGLEINVTENQGYTPLHIACSTLDLSVVRVLLANGAKVDARAADGDLPIHALVTTSSRYRPAGTRYARIDDRVNSKIPQVLDLLVEHGANVNAPGSNGKTVLHGAASLDESASVAEWLIDRGADVEALDEHGNTPLLHAYSRDESTDFIEVLLKRGADIEKHIQRHRHELECALDRHDLALAGVLIDRGVSSDMSNERRKPTSIHEAAREGPKLLSYLLNQGNVDLEQEDLDGYTVLGAAVEGGQTKSVEILLDHGANYEIVGPCTCRTPGYTTSALRVAADNGDVETLRLLLAAGADPNARNHNNTTVLKFAAEYGTAKCLSILLEVPGIQVNAVDNDGNSALLRAVRGRRVNATKILLARPDVDRSIRNKLGLTAEELASREKISRIVRLFGGEDQEEVGSHSDSDWSSGLIEVIRTPRRSRGRYAPVRVYPRRPRMRYPRRSIVSDD